MSAELKPLDIEKERADFEKEVSDARFFPAEFSFARTNSPSGRDEYANSHLQSRWEGWLAAKRATQPTVTGEAVAWAVQSPKGGIHKLAITRESAERKCARWLEEWPNTKVRIRPLVFGDEVSAVTGEAGGDGLPSPRDFSPTIVDCDGLAQAIAAVLRSNGHIVQLADLYALIDAWGEKQRKFAAERAVKAAGQGGEDAGLMDDYRCVVRQRDLYQRLLHSRPEDNAILPAFVEWSRSVRAALTNKADGGGR